MNYTSQGTMIYYHCDGNVTYTKVKLKRRILVTCGAEVNYLVRSILRKKMMAKQL